MFGDETLQTVPATFYQLYFFFFNNLSICHVVLSVLNKNRSNKLLALLKNIQALNYNSIPKITLKDIELSMINILNYPHSKVVSFILHIKFGRVSFPMV